MAADFQLRHPGVLVPDDVNDTARAQTVLLLGKNAGPGTSAQPHHAAGGTALAVQHLHHGGFARTVGTRDDEPLSTVDRVSKRLQQCPLPDPDGQVFHQHQLIPGLHIIFKAEFELVGLILGASVISSFSSCLRRLWAIFVVEARTRLRST